MKSQLKVITNTNWETKTEEFLFNYQLRLDMLSSQIKEDAINIENYEAVKTELAYLQKEINKTWDADFKPLKQALAYIKDKVVGQFEKDNVLIIKDLKKEWESRAIEAGILEVQNKKESVVMRKPLDIFKDNLISFITTKPRTEAELIEFIKEWK